VASDRPTSKAARSGNPQALEWSIDNAKAEKIDALYVNLNANRHRALRFIPRKLLDPDTALWQGAQMLAAQAASSSKLV
jgi:hypothetical protein